MQISMIRIRLGFAAFTAALFILYHPNGFAQSTWNVNDNGNWSDASKWTGGVPDAIDASARLDYDIAPDRTVTLDTPATVGTLYVRDSTAAIYNWILDGANALTLERGSGSAEIENASSSGTVGNQINVPLILASPLVLKANQSTAVTFNGDISGPGSFTFGAGNNTFGERGRVTLTGNNTFLGDFFSSFTINTSYGPLQIGSDTALGAGTAQLRGMRIVPFGGNRTLANEVAISNNDLTVIASPYSLEFQGAATIDANRVFTIDNAMFALSGGLDQIGANRALTKAGAGYLWLAGTSSYSGTTTINAGVLRATDGIGLPADVLLQLRGGILEVSADFSRDLGAAAGEINWATSNGGFAAYGAHASVDLNDPGPDDLVWGTTPHFLADGAVFLLNAPQANRRITFVDNLSLGSDPATVRTIQVADNPEVTTDRAVLSGVISGQGHLRKTGAGTLELTSANTYAGSTTIAEGTLALSDSGNFGPSTVKIERAADLAVSGSDSGNTDITMASLTVESAGVLSVVPGSGHAARLTIGEIARTPGGVLLMRGTALGSAVFPTPDAGNIVVTDPSGLHLTGGGGSAGTTTLDIVPYAIGSTAADGTGTDLVTYSATGIQPLNAEANEYKTTIDAAQSQLDNVRLSTALVLNGTATINALVIDDGGSLSGTSTLTVDSGAILALPGAGTIGKPLACGAAEGIVHATGPLTISSAISGAGGLTKAGPATLTLSSTAHTFTGPVTISEGLLDIGAGTVFGNLFPPAPVTLKAGATLRYPNNLYIGALAGEGQVQGTSGNNIIRFGRDNSDFTFGGTTSQAGGHPGVPGFDKQGKGTATIVCALGTLGSTFGVTDGTLRFYDLGTSPVGGTVYNEAVLLFDNTGIQVENRTRAPSVGGEYKVLGNLAANTAAGGPANTSFHFNQLGNPTLTLVPGAGFECQYRQRNGGDNNQFSIGASVTALVRGDGLGQTSGTRSRFTIRSNNLNILMIGGAGQKLPTWSGGGLGTPQISVLYRSYGDDNSMGLGAGFVTYHPTGSSGGAGDLQDTDRGVRLLDPAEYSAALNDGDGEDIATIANTRLGTAINGIDSTTRINTLLLDPGGAVSGEGTLTVESGLIMSKSGTAAISTADLTTGSGGAMRVIAPNAADLLTISSAITTTDGLIKSGEGTVVLSNAANAYNGATMLARGALRATDGTSLPSGSSVYFTGGVLESAGTFNRTIGTGGTQVRWDAFSSGGFAAQGSVLNVELNGGTGVVNWKASNFVQGHRALRFGSVTADNIVDFRNGLNLNTYDFGTGARFESDRRIIDVTDNPNSTADRARISGNITGTDARIALHKTGDGTLELAGSNTYAGPTVVEAGTLMMTGSNTGGRDVTIRSGATFAPALRSPTVFGTMSITGALTFETGSILDVELLDGFNGFGVFDVVEADSIVTNGMTNLAGNFEIRIVPVDGIRVALQIESTLSFPPDIVNHPATNVSVDAVHVNGELISAGTAVPTIYLLWGATDGGTNWNDWTYHETVAVDPDVGPITTNITLPSQRVWYYTYAASNAVGVAYAKPSAALMNAAITVAETDPIAYELGEIPGLLTVLRPAGIASVEPFTFDFTVAGTARTDDYTPAPDIGPGFLTFGAGESSLDITITPIYDERLEPDETVTVTLTETGAFLIDTASGTVTIINHDIPYAGNRWQIDGNALWSNPDNWVGAVPNEVDDVAGLRHWISMDRAVQLDINATVGTLEMEETDNTGASWTIGGTHTLTFEASGGNASLNVYNSVANQIARPIVLLSDVDVTVAADALISLTQAVTGPGGLTLAGGGELRLANANNTYSGPTVLSAGNLRATVSYATSPFSTLDVGADTLAQMHNQNTVGSLAGAGQIRGSASNDQLTWGANDTDTSFSGTFPNWGGGGGWFRKIGRGTFEVLSNTGGHTVQVVGGTVAVRDAGVRPSIARPGGTIIFDSRTQNLSGRGFTTTSVGGGEVVFRGGTSADSTLDSGGVTLGDLGNPILTIVPGDAPHYAYVRKTHNNSDFQLNDGYALLVRGPDLGGRGRFVIAPEYDWATARKRLIGGRLSYIHNGDYPHYQDYGTPQVPVLRHTIADTNVTGRGFAFATYQAAGTSAGGNSDPGIRPLTDAEYGTTIVDGEHTVTLLGMENKRIGTAVTGIDTSARVTSLTLIAGGSVAGDGTLIVQGGGILSLAPDAALTVATLQPGQTTLKPDGEQISLITPEPEHALRIAGALTGTILGLVKAGAGTATLTGVNTYTGPTTVQAGALNTQDGTGLPAVSNLRFTGGVLETSGTFSRSLGTGAGQVQWINTGHQYTSGGFAAQGGKLTVTLNNNENTVTWGAASFVGRSAALRLGSVTADSVTDFRNGLNLGIADGLLGRRRTLHVENNPTGETDRARLSGTVSGTDARVRFTKTGGGLLDLAGENTYHAHTHIEEGTLLVSGSCSNTVGVTVHAGATLAIGIRGIAAAGVMHVNGTLTFEEGSFFDVELLDGFAYGRSTTWNVVMATSVSGPLPRPLPSVGVLSVEPYGAGEMLQLTSPRPGTLMLLR